MAGMPIGWASTSATGTIYLFDQSARNLIAGPPNHASFIFEDSSGTGTSIENRPDIFVLQEDHGAARSTELSPGSRGDAIRRQARSFGPRAAVGDNVLSAGSADATGDGEQLRLSVLIRKGRFDEVLSNAQSLASEHIQSLIDAAKVNGDAAWVLARLAEKRPELFKAEHIPEIIEAAKVDRDAAWALAHFAEKRPKLFKAEHIPGIIEAAKMNEGAARVLAHLAEERPELAEQIIPGMIDAAKVNRDAARMLARLAERRPELFKAEHIPGIIEAAKVNGDAARALARLAEKRPELFRAEHIPGIIEAAKVNGGAAWALFDLAKKRPELFKAEHIPEIIEAAKANGGAAWALAGLAEKRPELAEQIVPGMVEAAKVNRDAARALAHLAEDRPELFKAEHIPGIIGAAKVGEDVAWALAHLAEERPELAEQIIPGMIDAAKVNGYAAGALADLAEERPELAEQIIPGMIDAAKVNGDTAWVLARLAEKRPELFKAEHIPEIIDAAKANGGAVQTLLNLIKNPNLLTRDRILSFCDGTANALGAAFLKNIEVFFFLKPDLFSPDVIEAFRRSFASLPAFRYLEFYAAPHAPGSGLFPHQVRFKELMARGPKRVLVWHNINDGMGDELIRNTTLIQALLDFNPELEVVICTGRPFLYTTALSGDSTSVSHPRVTVRHISDANNLKMEESFDMVVHHYDKGQRYDDAIEERIKTFVREKGPKIYVKTNKSSDKFVYEKAVVDGRDVKITHYDGNVYVPGYRLSAELGMSFRSGVQGGRHRERSFLVAHPNPIAEAWWQGHVVALAGGRPVILVNGFGGEGEVKGYRNNPEGQNAFADAMTSLVAKGFFVVVLPNHQPYGTYRNALDVKNLLAPDVARHVTIAPSPVPDSSDKSGIEVSDPIRATLHKYFVSYADGIVTVEGGMMHLAYNIGQKFEAISMPSSGNFGKWFPAGASLSRGQSASSKGVTGDGLRR